MDKVISVTMLVLHFYYYCYTAFEQCKLTLTFTDRLLANIRKTGLFNQFNTSKLFALGFLIISLLGAKAKMNHELSFKKVFIYLVTGLLTYFLSYFILVSDLSLSAAATWYMLVTKTVLYDYGFTF